MNPLEQISKFSKENSKPLNPSELKAEAQRLASQLEKQSAGRVYVVAAEPLEETVKIIQKQYEDRRQFYNIVGGKPVFIHRSLQQRKRK
jgi:hypothetical protein